MESPSVSLVIPCHNHAETVGRAVASGLLQSALQEVVIVDDCSTDASNLALVALAAQDERIRVVRTSRNLGPGGARNIGVAAAGASHICFLDADDELIGDFFHDALAVISANPSVRMVKGEMEFFDPVKGYILPDFDPRHKSAILSSSCGMIMARSLFLRIGGFPEDEVFRGPSGGEDVALMGILIDRFQPIGRVERPCYRVWSRLGSHVDKFLKHTRLKGASFEFCGGEAARMMNDDLGRAIGEYRLRVEASLAGGNPTGFEGGQSLA